VRWLLPRNAPPKLLRQVFESAVTGRSVPSRRGRPRLGLGWGPAAAGWSTMPRRPARSTGSRASEQRHRGQAGERASYSERAMFRLLRQMYVRIVAPDRTEPWWGAHGRGWL
jgi:hypothetical protein